MSDPILIAKGQGDLFLLPRMSNRHGLIAGATGTGKTVTLQKMAEGFSRLGVPVFLADIKGDLSGLAEPGAESPKLRERLNHLGITDFPYAGCPIAFWDVFAEQGHPIRATVCEMGPVLFSRLLNLNETQAGVLQITFKIADEQGLLLLDLKDLRAMLQMIGEKAKEITLEYGNVSPASIGAIQRALLALEAQGGDKLLGEPALDFHDLMRVEDGAGVVNILAADKLLMTPKTYSTFLLWMLSELFENLPEVGDLDKPKLVFFFDEAHLLFNDASTALQEKIEQVVRLIRSKGVGVYFISQNPLDIPELVLGQLGNRVQHALRAFTPRDQRAVKSAAETFRANKSFNTEEVITQLAVGEALISFLDEKGTPRVVDRAMVIPPHSRIGPITPADRQTLIRRSRLFGKYEKAIDRESAYEVLKKKVAKDATPAETPAPSTPTPSVGKAAKAETKKEPKSWMFGAMESFAKSAARTLGNLVIRGVLGNITKRR